MKITILKTTILATLASFAMSGYTWAHHMSVDVNPNYDFVDEQINENHNNVLDALLGDEDMMMSAMRGTGGGGTMSMGGGSNASQVSNQGSVPTAPGISNAGQSRSGAGR